MSDAPPPAPRPPSPWALRFVGILLVLAVALELVNWGLGPRLLQNYHREYSGGGSWKWRGSNLQTFHLGLLFVWMWVQPACLVVGPMLLSGLRRGERRGRIEHAVGLLVVLLIFARFWQLGVIGGALNPISPPGPQGW